MPPSFSKARGAILHRRFTHAAPLGPAISQALAATVGGTCGMYLREVEEGRGELTLFFDAAAIEETRFQFSDG
jgi:hypothetical protein